MINTQNRHRLGVIGTEEGEGRARAGAPEKCEISESTTSRW